MTPSWRGSAGSEYQSWEIFSVATDDGVGNRPDQPGSIASATLTQHSTDAFLTGSGNIYNPAGVSSFTVRDSVTEPVGSVAFQARTLGSELDYSTVRLSYDLGAGTQFLTATRIENDRGTILGASVSSLWEWNLTGLGVSSYEIHFTAGGTSLSFDSATLDTRAAGAVPEPSTWALMLVGSLGLGVVIRRSRRA
ncbi:MAG: PEP-CTERM sorting domain-containing protein [Verrucomicrobia bacterium]|nr:PEP-CTERM sorting domain-containing protein [Verrucomicrobiota bacterium]